MSKGWPGGEQQSGPPVGSRRLGRSSPITGPNHCTIRPSSPTPPGTLTASLGSPFQCITALLEEKRSPQPNPTQPPNAQLKAVASRLIATDPPSPPPPKKKFGAPFKRAQDPGTMRPRSTTATEGGKKDPLVEHPPPPAAAHLRARGRARCSLPLSPPLSPPPNGSAARPRRPGAWTEGMDAAAGVGGGPGAVHRRLSAPRRGAAGPQRRPRCRPPAPAPTAAAMVRLHAGRAPLTGAGRAEGREH